MGGEGCDGRWMMEGAQKEESDQRNTGIKVGFKDVINGKVSTEGRQTECTLKLWYKDKKRWKITEKVEGEITIRFEVERKVVDFCVGQICANLKYIFFWVSTPLLLENDLS